LNPFESTLRNSKSDPDLPTAACVGLCPKARSEIETDPAIRKPMEPIAKTLLGLLKCSLKRLLKCIVFAFDSKNQYRACTGLVN
jgi:hypothetical protein